MLVLSKFLLKWSTVTWAQHRLSAGHGSSA